MNAYRLLPRQRAKSILGAKLQEAAQTPDALGDQLLFLQGYDSGPEIAAFLRSLLPKIEADTLSREEQRELWLIFAATSHWDDCGGDSHVGDQLFALIERVYPSCARS